MNHLTRSTEPELAHEFVRGVSLIAFVLTPVFALLLMLFYRRGQYYLAQLMMAIPVHCFAFVLLSLSITLRLPIHLSVGLLLGL